MFFNMCVCFFLITGSMNTDNLISQNKQKKVHKEKVKKPVKVGNSCSVKKCSIV